MIEKLQYIFEKFNYPGKNKLTLILKKLGIKKTTKEITDFIDVQAINQVFNEPKKIEGHIVAFHHLDRVQMDIIDMSKFYNTNGHFSYVILIIDVFSRKLWGYATKDKTIESVEKVVQKFCEKNKPNIIVSDNESAFMSDKIQKLFETLHIKHITADVRDHNVLGIIDRVCRTMKTLVYKYMSENRTTKYLEHLNEIVDAYNNTPHRGIFYLSPNEATLSENYQKIFDLNLEKGKNNNKYINEFAVGDTIRVRNRKKQFERAFEPKYSEVKTISEMGKKRAVLTDGDSVDLRRLKKVVSLKPSEKHPKVDVLNEALRNNKIEKAIKREHLEIETNEKQLKAPHTGRVLRSTKETPALDVRTLRSHSKK